MTYDPTSGFNPNEFRATTVNWINEVNEIMDGYAAQHVSISHAVQKDGIQNGWDARCHLKSGLGWKYTFELIENKNITLLTMTDEGTRGLTGKVLTPAELEKDLKREERWGRFENLAFKNDKVEDKELLGSRGRGKFVFVGASQDRVIFYDTLREDGSYRWGQRHVVRTSSPIVHKNEDEGKQALALKSNNLLIPLNKVGTRVVIVNPQEEVIEEIKNGNFSKYIGATWWEIITKHNAEINLIVNSKKERIKAIPEILPVKDSPNVKVWKKDCVQIPKAPKENNLKCKTLHVVYDSKKKVDSEIKGISIQRAGMKICCYPLNDLPVEIRDYICGYITLEHGWDDYLRKAEGIEHYSLDFRKEPANYLRDFINYEVMEFAKQKLNYGPESKTVKKDKQKTAEKRALNGLNKFAKKMGVFGDGPGEKDIRIVMPPPKFPRVGDLRINWGESLDDIAAKVVNDTPNDLEMKIKFSLRDDNNNLIKKLHEEEIKVKSNTGSPLLGKINIAFTESEYPAKGKYHILCRLVNIGKHSVWKLGWKFDEVKCPFYLEEDPPEKGGLFEEFKAVSFKTFEGKEMLQAAWERSPSGKYLINYNIDHSGYDSCKDEDDWTMYLFKIGVPELCEIDIKDDLNKLFKDEDKEHPELVVKKMRLILGQMTHFLNEGEF